MKKTLLAVALATASLAAYADTIALYNTGTDSTGTVLAAGSADTDYTVITPAAVTNFGYVAADSYPVGNFWLANDAVSKWLAPTANAADGAAAGVYTWETTFDLTGFYSNTASFTGRFSADNSAMVYLNGTLLGTSTGYSSWDSFTSISSAFNAGMNTLDFVVANIDGQTGLRVEFTDSSVVAVPEPETYAMLLAGLGLMGFMARRRKA